MITTEKLKQSKPQIQINWTGAPIAEGEGYYGAEKPSEEPLASATSPATARKRTLTPQGLANLRASMAKARAALISKQQKRKALLKEKSKLREGL